MDPSDVQDGQMQFRGLGSGIEVDHVRQRHCVVLPFLLPAILLALAGVANSVMDTLTFHYEESVFKSLDDQEFWDPSQSWTNKYKNNDPTQGEKFFLSTTSLVFLTDAWHLFKWLMLSFIALAAVALIDLFQRMKIVATWKQLVAIFALFKIVFGVSFELCWSYVWVNGK